MGQRHLTGGVVAALALGVAAVPPARPAAVSKQLSSSLAVISDVTLTSVRFASDVRWAGDGSVLLAGGRDGLLELPIAGGAPRVVIPGASARDGFWLTSRVAASTSHLAVASPVFSMAWTPRSRLDLAQDVFEFVVDLDIDGDRVAVLGAKKDPEKGFAPDGAIAWVATLGSKELTDIKPIYYSLAGPVALPMANCGMLETGGVRFLPDGTLLVVPGVEPGVFLYDRSGRLVRSWETQPLGLDTDCRLGKGEERLIAASLEHRFARLNARRTIEDILPLPQGPALVARRFEDGVVRWQLLVLQQDRHAAYELPFTSSSPKARLRGDVRNGKLAFVIQDLGIRDLPPPRLVVTTAPR